ncbi:MAG: histone H1 [Bacteroidales bacterium]|nr:histone H1 [Bacteroidales bacterium]
MEELVNQIEGIFNDFLKDAKAQANNGNKAAGQRARKASLEIEKLTKQFRKDSIEAAKK